MSFVPDYKLSELSKMAGFDTVDELAKYASTTRQNLDNWNKSQSKQGFLRVVIMGAKVSKAQDIKRRVNTSLTNNNTTALGNAGGTNSL